MRPSLRTWLVPAAALLLVALFVADLMTSDDTVLVALYALGPLIAVLGGGPRAVAAVGGLALALAVAHTVDDVSGTAQDVVRVATVALSSLLAVWIAALRERTQRVSRETEEALGFLTAVFEHAPVGIALLDTDLRFVRVNDQITEINGMRAADHVGRTIADVLPGLPPEVAADAAEVARTGRRVSQMEVVGSTPARPGVTRHWIVSYWPVRTPLTDDLVGVGIVVDEVTERRTAERALRAQTDRYEALLLALSEAGEGLVVLERDGRCVYANAAFEQLSGYTFPELAAMDSVLDLVADDEREDARQRAAARIEQGTVEQALALTLRRRDGATLDLEVGGVPLDVEDRHQLVVVVRDVSERRRAEAEREALLQRSALVAEASEVFDQSLDEQLTMDSVARLCVRELADTCVILLGSEPERVRRVAVVARDRAREQELAEALLRAPLEERDDRAVLAAMATGTAAVTDAPGGLGTRALTVALRARGRTHGVLVAGFDALAPRDELELLALFEDLGRRAALALDNARLYEERDQVARTLQQSLLPTALPDIPGVEIAARYVAAGDGNEVGGDFYDCFATGTAGHWALVIGDVCGKGAEAATLTALARYTLRAAAAHTRRPRAVLSELNDALLRQSLDYRFCTVLYVSLTPRGSHVEAIVGTGGHPLPLVLRASGEVETVGRPGTLLGILDNPELSEQGLALLPGDALVLYTDGVTETTATAWATGGRLEELLATCAGGGASTIAEAVEREAVDAQDGPPRDDVAVVVIRALHGRAPSFDLTDQGVAAPS